MKTILITLFCLASLSLSAQAKTSAEELYDAKCSSCHIKTRPINKASLIAPPIMGVMRHVKMNYATKEEAVKFISDYVMNPQKAKSICMEDKIERFGLMPSQKGNLSDEELHIISEWIYDNFPPLGFGGKNAGKGCKN